MIKHYIKIPLTAVVFIMAFMLSMGTVLAKPDDDPVYKIKEHRQEIGLDAKTNGSVFSGTWNQYGNANQVMGSVQCSVSATRTGKSDLKLYITAVNENGKSISGSQSVKISCHKGWQRDGYVGFSVDGLKLKNATKYKLKFKVTNSTKYNETVHIYYVIKPVVGKVSHPAPTKPSKDSKPTDSGLPVKCQSIKGDKYDFPGADCFQLNKKSPYVQVLDELLIQNGANGIVKGPRFTQAEINAVRAFQLAHSDLSRMADGYPGEKTWDKLVAGAKKKDNNPSKKPNSSASECKKVVYSGKAPKFPGAECFVKGKSNPHVKKLGEMLTKAGYGKGGKGFYKVGPSPKFTEIDRLSLQRFQADHQELAGDADGYPGSLTWKILVKEAGLSK